MIGDRARDALRFRGLYGRPQGLILLVDELVLVVMVRALAEVADPDPLFSRPPGDDVGPDAALDRLLAEHLADLGPVEHLDLGVDADLLVVDPERLGDLRALGLTGLGEREDLELEPRPVARLAEELLGLGRVVPVT